MATDRSHAETGWLTALVESAGFRHFITGLILINAAMLGLETYDLPGEAREVLRIADRIVIGVFAVEIALKLIAWRGRFFRSGWNWFDLIVVAISLIPAAGPFTVLRALRVLRLFRLFSVVPQMRKVVEGLMRAIPGMGAILMVLALVFYVAAVMASNLFSGTHPELFDDLGASAFTLFQIMTLDSWASGIARPITEVHPLAWIFFVGFVILTTFAVVNLFIAVLVDSLQSKHLAEDDAREKLAHDERAALLDEVRALRADIARMRGAPDDSAPRPD